MLRDIINTFMICNGDSFKLIEENYSIKKARYVIVDMDNNYSYKLYDATEENIEELNQYRTIDFLGNAINTNSCLDLPGKKVLSNSIYSFFIKNKAFAKDITENINKYFNNAISLDKENEEVGERNRKWILDNLDKFKTEIIDETYLRILFINKDFIKLHYESYKKYIKNKMWLDKTKDNVGIIKFNFTINVDKYFLQSKLRGITNHSYLSDEEYGFKQMVFLQFLNMLRVYKMYVDTSNNNIYLGDTRKYVNGYMLTWELKDGSAVIKNIDEISRFNGIEKMQINEYIPVKIQSENWNYLEYGEFNIDREVRGMVNAKIYSKESKKINEIRSYLIKIIDNIENYKGMESAVIDNLYRKIEDALVTLDINSNLTREIVNILLSFINYFTKEEEVSFMDMERKLKDIISGDAKIENDNELSYAIGQVAAYLIHKKIGKKDGRLLKTVSNCKRSDRAIDVITNLYTKHGHSLSTYKDNAFNRLYVEINRYAANNKLNKRFILMGALSENIMYTYSKLSNVIEETVEVNDSSDYENNDDVKMEEVEF